MSSPTQVLKSVGPKLVPFFKTLAIYFVTFIPFENPSLWSTLIKVLPMLSLILFVSLHGVGLKDEYTFSRRILIGLIFSTFGDAFLVWNEYFIFGMASFGIAHIFYMNAFGLSNLNMKTGIVLFTISSFVASKILPGTTGIFTVGVVLYTICITTMLWSATSRLLASGKNWSWTDLLPCIGGLIFAISDTIIAFDKFISPVANAQLIIMTTYYFSQFAIALSVVGSSSTCKQAQEKLQGETESEITGKSGDLFSENARIKTKTRS